MAKKYDEERVPLAALEIGNLVRPPLVFGSSVKVIDKYECSNHPGYWHVIVEGTGDSLVRGAQIFGPSHMPVTLLVPHIDSVYVPSGAAWLDKLKADNRGNS